MVPVRAGPYDVYTVNAEKGAEVMTLGDEEIVYIARRDDAAAQTLCAELRKTAGAAPAAAKKAARTAARKADPAENAEIMFVLPPAVFGGEAVSVTMDGKRKKEKAGKKTFSLQVRPGSYTVHGTASTKPRAVVTLAPGQLLYAVNRSDAPSQRQLGDLFFDYGNRRGAFALYRAALAADSAMTNLYRRYADLALEVAGADEAIRALQRLVQSGQADGQTCHMLGKLLAAANRNEEAKQMFDQALRLSGNDVAVLCGLAAVKMKTGDFAGAAQAYDQAISMRPDSSRLYVLLGEAWVRQKDTAKAVTAYGAFFDKGGASASVALLAGGYEYRQGNWQEAVRFLKKVTGKQAEKFECLYMLGQSYYRLGDLASARRLLGRAAQKYPKAAQWPAAVETLIAAAVQARDYKKAGIWIDTYARSGRQRSANVAYYRALVKERTSAAAARVLYEQNMKKYPADHRNFLRCGALLASDSASLKRALELLKKAALLADTVPEAWLKIAQVYRKLGQYDEELLTLQVYVSADTADAAANARIGELMLRKGDAGGALVQLEAAEKSASNDPAVLKALAQGYASTGRTGEAIAVLARAKAGAPGDISIRERLIELYRKQGATDSVLQEYRQLLDVRRDTATLIIYAALLYQNGKFEEARNAIEDLRAIAPDNIRGLMLLGRVLRAQQKCAEAVEVYKEISFIDASYADALFERAETHLACGQPHWAEAFYQRTLKARPNFAAASLGLARVAKLRRNRSAYKSYVARAYKLAPDDPAVAQEYAESLKPLW
jgi:tetratricopeptide (TPR) repeat protein